MSIPQHPTQVFIARNALTKEIYRVSGYVPSTGRPVSGALKPLQVGCGRLMGQNWEITNIRSANEGNSYALTVEPLWSILRRITLGGQWIHMHPLDAARNILRRALGTTVEQETRADPVLVDSATLAFTVDSTRSHFSVTRAKDIVIDESPQTIAEGYIRSHYASDRWEDSDVQAQFQRIVSWLELQKRTEVDGGIFEPTPAADLLNDLALHMSGGFYEAQGKIGFRTDSTGLIPGQEDFDLGSRASIARTLDEIYVREVVINFCRFAKDSEFSQEFRLKPPIPVTRGAEATFDLDWANGISELRPPPMDESERSTFRADIATISSDAASIYDFFYFDDLYLAVAYPSRGFSGARVRYRDSTQTYSIEAGAELDPGEDRVAYVKLITDGARDTDQADLSPVDLPEVVALMRGGRAFAWPEEIIVIDQYESKTSSEENPSITRFTDSGIPPGPNQDEVTYVRHPHFPHHRESAYEDLTVGIYDAVTLQVDNYAEVYRYLTPMVLRARVDSDYTDDGAEEGRGAFKSGRLAIQAGLPDRSAPSTFAEVDNSPYMRVINGQERKKNSARLNSPAVIQITGYREPSYGIVVDNTIPAYVAKTTLTRFEGGAGMIEVLAPLEFADVKMWDTVTLNAEDVDIPGKIGVDSATVLWEVTGVQPVVHTSPAGVRLQLTQLSTIAPVTPITIATPELTRVTPVRPPLTWATSLDEIAAGGRIASISGTADLEAVTA